MDKSKIEFLKKLVETPSPAGFEHQFQELVASEMRQYTDEVTFDVYGNLTGVLNPGGSLKIMLAGHADQVGLMVKHIDDEGYLYVAKLGAPREYVLAGQRVSIHSRSGPVTGVVMSKAPAAGEKELRMSGFWVDIAAADRADAASVVSPSDPVTWTGGLEFMRGDKVVATGFDDSVGVFIVVEVLRRLADRKFAPAVYGVSTVQEELGSIGARMSAFRIDPDVGIAIDVTEATDYPGTDKREVGEVALGKGPILFRGANINHVLGGMLIDAAEAGKIPRQLQGAHHCLWNDSSVMQYTRGGVAAACVGIPNRYMHTPVEMISLNDVEHAIDLLVSWLVSLDGKVDFNPVR